MNVDEVAVAKAMHVDEVADAKNEDQQVPKQDKPVAMDVDQVIQGWFSGLDGAVVNIKVVG